MTKVETLIMQSGRFGLYKRPNSGSWTQLTYLVGIELGQGKRVMLACPSLDAAEVLFRHLNVGTIVED